MEIDLSKFVSQEEGRYKIDAPFFRGDGWKYATDGRWCVRVKGDGDKTECSPSADTLFKDEIMQSDAIAIDESLFVPMKESDDGARISGSIKCVYCRGSGSESKVCVVCGGSGEEECPTCGSEEQCDECYGDGVHIISPYRCPFCYAGTKFADLNYNGVFIDACRVKYMQHYIPDLKIIPTSYALGSKSNPIAFISPTCQALLMPLQR